MMSRKNYFHQIKPVFNSYKRKILHSTFSILNKPYEAKDSKIRRKESQGHQERKSDSPENQTESLQSSRDETIQTSEAP